MIWYGKFAETGVAAASYLAVHYKEQRQISSEEIARARNISKALIAKTLTMLAAKKVVVGTRGPNGGYQLAGKPEKITLYDIVSVFEDPPEHLCPFGPGWCGTKEKCPLHDTIHNEKERSIASMKKTKLSVFCVK